MPRCRKWIKLVALLFLGNGVIVMALTATELEQQKKQAEELLFSGKETLGFAKDLFFGHFNASLVFPYPQLKAEEHPVVAAAVAEVRKYCDEKLDAVAIDRNADIPTE